MAVRFLVGDRFGVILGELAPDIGPISWRLNDVGKVTFSLARTDTKATERFLRVGNRIIIEFDNGLPNWGGVIDLPREWIPGYINCTAYSAESLLGLRTTDRGRYYSASPVGYIFQTLIQEANAVFDMGIGIGQVWMGGDSHSPEYHYKDLLKIIRDSLCSTLSTADFVISASESGGKIVFTANLYERKGETITDVALVEGANITSARLIEQGPIINAWNLAGEGNTWGDDRLTSHAEDTTSISNYGLREDSGVYSDVSEQATLDIHAENLLSESKDPHNMVEIITVDEEPAGFEDYDIGDSVSVQLVNYGFEGFAGTVHIEAREYDPGAGICRLVVREE